MGRLLAKRLDADFLSMGDILRMTARGQTKDARKIAELIDSGRGIPSGLSYELLSAAMAAREATRPLVLDGVPRLADQVGDVRALLGHEPTAAIVLEVPTPIAIERLMSRVTCASCNWPHGPGWPSSEGRCAQCGGPLATRPDDTAEGIARRHETWGMQARRITRYYEALGVARTIRADVPVLAVVQAASEMLAG